MNKEEFFNYISRLSLKSMLYEVAASPKPGLVDRLNSGAHKDMDYYTFINSSLVLGNYFYKCAEIGFEFCEDNILNVLRPIGINAEKLMYQATNGVNTHKGLIFSFGIITAVAGKLYRESKNIFIDSNTISDYIRDIAAGISNELNKNNGNLTYGKKIYQLYGYKGIRGEAESGFKTVMDISLPLFTRLIKMDKYHINDIMIECLLHIMANLNDTNVLGRHGIETLDYVKTQAKNVIRFGGYLTKEGKIMMLKMDRDFIEKNISPGGSADLLAITLLLYFLENGDKFNDRLLEDIRI